MKTKVYDCFVAATHSLIASLLLYNNTANNDDDDDDDIAAVARCDQMPLEKYKEEEKN